MEEVEVKFGDRRSLWAGGHKMGGGCNVESTEVKGPKRQVGIVVEFVHSFFGRNDPARTTCRFKKKPNQPSPFNFACRVPS